MLKPINFRSALPERRDPNFESFEERVKYKSKRELLYMCFLAVEALAVRDQQDAAAIKAKEAEITAKAQEPKGNSNE